ncbi:hypothetical protein D9M71_654110 [compost metagenome]
MAGVWSVLGAAATQAGITLPAGRDGTGNHPLPFDKTAYLRPQPLNDAHRLVAHGQPFGHRVFTAQDVYVGTTNSCGGDTDQCVQRSDFRDGLVFQYDSVLFDENSRSHGCHGDPPFLM